MTTVTTTDVVADTVADPSVINNNFASVKAAVNGGIENANIDASAAIAVSKLQAGTEGYLLKISSGVPTWGAAPSAAITISTTLPGTPSNGDQAILVDSTTAPTYQWCFQYSTGVSDSYKWVFIGGCPASHEIDTSQNIESSSYVDATTVGPTFTAPYAGIYEVSFGATIAYDDPTVSGPDTFYVALKNGTASTSDVDAAIVGGHLFNQQGEASVSRTRRVTATASAVLKLQYRGSTAASEPVSNRWMKVTPLRVG